MRRSGIFAGSAIVAMAAACAAPEDGAPGGDFVTPSPTPTSEVEPTPTPTPPPPTPTPTPSPEPACPAIVDDALCDDGVACNGEEVCDPVAGCVSTPLADGTPCDEGLGANGDFCDSSCRSGSCRPLPPMCSPELGCEESCAPPPMTLVAREVGDGFVEVDLVVDLRFEGENLSLGAYDLTVIFDADVVSIDCPAGLSQPSEAFDNPAFNRCALDLSDPAAAKLRLIDVNDRARPTPGPLAIKTLRFEGSIPGLTLQLRPSGIGALLDVSGAPLPCGDACALQGLVMGEAP